MVQKEAKPIKKTDKELWILIDEKIQSGDYIFLNHAKDRQKEQSNLLIITVIWLKDLEH